MYTCTDNYLYQNKVTSQNTVTCTICDWYSAYFLLSKISLSNIFFCLKTTSCRGFWGIWRRALMKRFGMWTLQYYQQMFRFKVTICNLKVTNPVLVSQKSKTERGALMENWSITFIAYGNFSNMSTISLINPSSTCRTTSELLQTRTFSSIYWKLTCLLIHFC